ncbi:MAG: hypothetical protein PHQ04_04890 [Opitutaceae bacterium]|nr:hypothetical protein [Opitutaceae bacterium]
MSDEVVALGANRAAERMLGKPSSAMRGMRGGTIIECVYAQSPEGCGGTEHCSGCTLRRIITATAADGQPRYGATSVHLLRAAQGLKEESIRFSTRMVGQMVFVTLEGLHVPNDRVHG